MLLKLFWKLQMSHLTGPGTRSATLLYNLFSIVGNSMYIMNFKQAMRVIINDRRYGALRSLGERKQTFNEVISTMKLFRWVWSNNCPSCILLRSYYRLCIICVSVCGAEEKT